MDAMRYQSIVGGLHYLTHTQPDIAFAVGYVSRFMEDPREDHWMAVKRLLRYVKGTLDQAIIFPRHGGKSGLQLVVFSEAPPRPMKVSQSSWSSAMQTWQATEHLWCARLPWSSPHCLPVAEAKDRGAVNM
jgi:hypothetical protein